MGSSAEMDQVQVVVQSQSVIHSMVEFEDGRDGPAGNAGHEAADPVRLCYPEREAAHGRGAAGFLEIKEIRFEEPDLENFGVRL